MDLPASPQRRDAHDFERAYRQHFGRVWSALARLGVQRADLEDAVHDVFLVAHRRRETLTHASSMRTWLLGICRRVASDHRRRHHRHRRRVDGLQRQGTRVVEPNEALWHREGARHLQRFLLELDDTKREIFVMVELEQLTGTEAARLLGINRNTAAARLRAARMALDEYARAVRQPPARLLTDARREPPPEPAIRRRVMGLLFARLVEAEATPSPSLEWVAPQASLTTSPLITTLKAGAISLALAGAGLGGIRLGVERWGSSPNAVLSAAAEPRTSADVTAPEHPPAQSEPDSAAANSSAVHPTPIPRSLSASSIEPSPGSQPPHAATGAPTPPESPIAGSAEIPGDDPLHAQSQALHRARVALREGDPNNALALVNAITQTHPTGALAPELALVRIEALCTLGQRAQARGEARVLRRAHRGSPVAERATCPHPNEG